MIAKCASRRCSGTRGGRDMVAPTIRERQLEGLMVDRISLGSPDGDPNSARGTPRRSLAEHAQPD